MINVGVGGAWLPVTPYIGVGGVWKQITGYWIGVGGVWQSMAILPMTLSASPTSAGAAVKNSSPSRPSITTGSVAISVTGGSGTFTYAWTVVFDPASSIDSTGTCSANSPTSATTTFTGLTCDGTISPGSDYYTATVTVTDAVSGQIASLSVPITLSNTYSNIN